MTEPIEPKTYQTADVREYLFELDALRGIAILGVLEGISFAVAD